MRYRVPLALLAVAAVFVAEASAEKMTDEQRVALIRALTAEYATAKIALPRSKKDLKVETNGSYDKEAWEDAQHQFGPAARVGDLVQVTHIDLQDDKIVFVINGGFGAGKSKWYQHIQIGANGNTQPISRPSDSTAPGGTSIVLLFHKPLPVLKPEEIKKMLAPVLDFEKRSVAQTYVESLPPEMQAAVKEKRVVEGMDREMVLTSVGRPVRKVRNIEGGEETEDWVYGTPPGKITFVTFKSNKVIKVKETYAGLGSQTTPELAPTH